MHDLLLHAFLAAPFYPARCDAKIDDGGQPRTCTRPPSEHLDQQPIGSLPEKMPAGLTVTATGSFIEVSKLAGGFDLMGPEHALGLARALILAAYQTGWRHG